MGVAVKAGLGGTRGVVGTRRPGYPQQESGRDFRGGTIMIRRFFARLASALKTPDPEAIPTRAAVSFCLAGLTFLVSFMGAPEDLSSVLLNLSCPLVGLSLIVWEWLEAGYRRSYEHLIAMHVCLISGAVYQLLLF